jgi:hypothetical protein
VTVELGLGLELWTDWLSLCVFDCELDTDCEASSTVDYELTTLPLLVNNSKVLEPSLLECEFVLLDFELPDDSLPVLYLV